MDDLREIEPCKGFGGGCRGMDCPVCDGARVIQQLRNDSEGYVADYILELRGRLEAAESQIQDAWRELACSDDITATTLAGGINQLQRARETAEAKVEAVRDVGPVLSECRWFLVDMHIWPPETTCAVSTDLLQKVDDTIIKARAAFQKPTPEGVAE